MLSNGIYNETQKPSRVVSSAQSPTFHRGSIKSANQKNEFTNMKKPDSPQSNRFRSDSSLKIKKVDAMNNYFKSKAFMSRQAANICTSQSTSRLLNK